MLARSIGNRDFFQLMHFFVEYYSSISISLEGKLAVEENLGWQL